MMSDANRASAAPTKRPRQLYLQGVGYGLIPAGVEGAATYLADKTSATDLGFLLGNIGLILYCVAATAALIWLILPARRWMAAGLLTVLVLSGIVVFGLLSQASP